MVKNDGSRTNREAFWSYMEPELPLSTEESEDIALKFYEDEFNRAIRTTKPTAVSNQIVKRAKERGFEIYLATNPVFPQCATLNRIRWSPKREAHLENKIPGSNARDPWKTTR